MTYYRYEAKNLFGHVATERTHILRMAMLAAIGSRAMEGKLPLLRDTLSTPLRGSISFYPNEAFFPKAPRITVTFIDRNEREDLPARAVIEVDYVAYIHKRVALEIDVIYPDRFFGFGRLVGAEDVDDRYPIFCFNLTPGETCGNLFDPIASVCAAFANTESSYDTDGAVERLDGISPGRFPSTYQALNAGAR